MHIEAFYNFCLSLPGTSEDFPFGEETLVFKVMGKMFALTNIESFESINLKCDPARALELRASYEEIKPGYHMNKKHWNTVSMTGSLDDELIKELIRHSYDLVVAKLPKKDREKL
jgi:predicted DNA-binding protein (MmcQ/YjbR family)